MRYFLNMCTLWSITSTNWLCRDIEMFSPSACILLYVCHFRLTCSHTVVHPHTHPQTLSLSVSWQCSEQSLSVLLTVIFPDECLFVSCVSPHTHTPLPTEARSWCTFWHTSDHPSTHPPVHPPSQICCLPFLHFTHYVVLQCSARAISDRLLQPFRLK